MTDIKTPSSHKTDTMELQPPEMLDDSTVMASLPPLKINAKTIGGMLYNTIRWRGSGCFKLNTLPDDLKKLNITSRSSTTETMQAFPTVLELAQLSQHAYTISDLKDKTQVPFRIEHMANWICIGTGRYSDGYCGAAYVNHKYSHVVIAHGGTDPRYIRKPVEFYRDIITDVGGVFLNKEVSQISSAYIFTKLIVNLCSDNLFSISVTGHSLGGWLAQISAFYIEHPRYISQYKEVKKIMEDKQRNLGIVEQVEVKVPYHLHTVSFDSPGCRQALKSIVGYHGSKKVEWRENVDTQDFTVIIAPSNAVNTCGEHVGYVLKLDMPGVQDISWGSASHDKQFFVDHLSSLNPKLKEVHDVYYKKAVKSEVESIILDQWYLGREDSCQVNIFSPKELTFLTHTQFILKWRNDENLESSDKKFEVIHKGACEILDMIEEKLKDFIEHFNVTHNVIEFSRTNQGESRLNMSEFILKLVRLLRMNINWWNRDGSAIQDMIRGLPRCREMVCESEGSLYVEGIPKLRCCTTTDLCNMVNSFLASDKYFLSINASSNGNECRLYMVHLFQCFGKRRRGSLGEHALFLNISSVQRLNREIDMTNVFSDTKYELIVVECDYEVNDINSVITGMIANAENENKKLIIVTCGENVQGVNNPQHNCGDDLTLQFENLDELSKRIISQCPVDIHGNTFVLGKSDPPLPCGQYLLDNICGFFNSNSLCSKIICEIFDGKVIDLSHGSLPIMAQHYMDRILFQITLNVGKLKEKAQGKDFSDVIVVSNSDRPIKELFPDLVPLYEKNLILEPVGEYKKEDFLYYCKSKLVSKNVHWFKREESTLVWQNLNGQPYFDYLRNDEGGIRESELPALQNNFIILADEPGMGKSAAITKLYLEYKNSQFNSKDSHINWPVYINLNDHQVELKTKTYSDYHSAITFLANAMNLDDEVEKSLFRFCLERTGNVTFFIDSFDEISQKGQYFVVRMFQELKAMTHSKVRVWIATRNYAKYELEKKLGTKSYRFHRVEEEAQIKFLVNYWTNTNTGEPRKNDDKVLEFAQTFAEQVIRSVQNVLGTDHTFIGIPLQLVLLAAIYNDSFGQLLERKLGNELSLTKRDWEMYSYKFSSTLELYNLFVGKKLSIWLGDKFKFDTRSDWMEHTLITRMNEIHYNAGFLYVNSSFLITSDMKIKSLSPADSYEVNRVGFCEISKSNIRFYHQTIAEYFTAQYLVNLIIDGHKDDVVSFLKVHYHKPYFKKIRHFLDSLLCTDIPGLKNLELLNTRESGGEIRDRFTDFDWQSVDALGRNLLHYAMAYGDHDSGIFWMIVDGFSLFHEKDLLGETCLSYLCLSENFTRRIFPALEGYRSYNRKRIPMHENSGNSDNDFLPRIRGVQVLYSIFCGKEFQNWFERYTSELITSDESSSEELNELDGIAGINKAKFFDFITSTGSDQLCQNVEINMKWLTHCTINGIGELACFLSRLCLHNSLDKSFGNIFLNEWFEACLGKNADNGAELGTQLVTACQGIDNWDKDVFRIIRTNLPHYYHNAFPYMYANDEYDLWNSCTDSKDKRQMLHVMKTYKFYSLVRAKQSNTPLFKEVLDFVDNESNEFRDVLNDGLVKAFQVFTFGNFPFNFPFIAFDIYDKSDAVARDRMILENFELKMDSTLQDKPKLKVKNGQTFMDIRNGKNKVWALKSLPKIIVKDYARQFFTLPVLAEYTQE